MGRAARCWRRPGRSSPTQRSLYRTPLGARAAGRAARRRPRARLQARVTEAGQRHPVTADLPQAGDPAGAGLGPLVPPGRRRAPSAATIADDRRRPTGRCWCSTASARAASRSSCPTSLAVGARLRGRRAAGRAAAPPRALADEGARARGGGAARHRRSAAASRSAPHPGRRLPAGDHDGAGRRAARARWSAPTPGPAAWP